MLGHALALTWDQLASFGTTSTAGPTTGSHPPGDTLRCKRSLVVPEYQPDVHRLRRIVLGLGPTNPEWTSLPQETLGLRRRGFSPLFSLLMPAGSLLNAPPVLSVWLQRLDNALLPINHPAGRLSRRLRSRA